LSVETPPRIQSHAHAERQLSDVAYMAYVIAQAAKLALALLAKRWPELK